HLRHALDQSPDRIALDQRMLRQAGNTDIFLRAQDSQYAIDTFIDAVFYKNGFHIFVILKIRMRDQIERGSEQVEVMRGGI
ncbi:hypothetical protein, partial [Novacetimonas hansenii]